MKIPKIFHALVFLAVLEAPAQQFETQLLDPQDLPRLVAEGQQELAARKMVEELHRLRSTPSKAELALLEQADALKLTDLLVAMEQPAKDSPHEDRRRYAMMLGDLGKRPEALRWLRVLAAEDPADQMIRAELLLALPFDEQLANLSSLGKGPSDVALMRWWFSKRSTQREQSLKSYLQVIEMLSGFLERLDPSSGQSGNLSWVCEEARNLIGGSCFVDVLMNSLACEPQAYSVRYNSKLDVGRVPVVRRLLQAMLRHEQTCRRAFQLMHACRAKLAVSPEQLDQAALSALSLSMLSKVKQAGGHVRERRYDGWSLFGNDPNEFEGGTMDMMEYLTQRSARNKTVDPFTGELLAGFAAANAKDARRLGELLNVVNEPGMAAFDSWRGRVNQEPNLAGNELLVLARLAIFKQRVDVLNATVDLANQWVLTRRINGSQEVIRVVALPVTTRDGLTDKTRAIEQSVLGLLGPREKWPLYSKANGNEKDADRSQRQRAFQSFCTILSSDVASAMAMTRFLAKNDLAGLTQMSMERFMTMADVPDQKALKEWMESDLFTFGPELCLSGARGEKSSILETAANALQPVWAGALGEFINSLDQTPEPQRFAARLLQARFTKKTEAAFAEIEHQAAAIAQWPSPARDGLARILRDWYGDACKTAGETTRKLLTQSQNETLSAARELARKYLRDGFPQDFYQRKPDSAFIGMMRCLIANDAALAADVWLKADDGSSNPPDGIRRGQILGAMYHSLLSGDALPFPALVAFVRQLESLRPGVIDAASWEDHSSAVNNSLHEFEVQCKRNAVQPTPGLSDIPRTCADALEELARSTPQEALPILVGLYGMAESSYEGSYVGITKKREDLIDWLRGDFRQHHPDLARAARLSVMTGRNVVLTDAYRQELQDDLATFLANDRIPAGLRFATMAKVLGRPQVDTWIDAPKCSEAVANMLATMLATDVRGLGGVATLFARFESSSPADAAKVLAAAQAMHRRQSSSSSADPIPLRTRLVLAIRGGQQEEVEQLMRLGANDFTGDLDLAIRLWRGNHGALAVSLIAAPDAYHQQTLRDPRWTGHSNESLCFTRGTEISLPGWLASIKDTGQRYQVECLICAARDATGAEAPEQARRERLTALVKRFPNEAPQARAARNEVLLALGSVGACAAPLAKDFVEAIGQRTLGGLKLAGQDRSYPDIEKALILRAMQFTIEETGDASLLARQVESICATVTGQETTRDHKDEAFQAMRDWLPWHSALLLRRMVELPPASRAQPAGQALRIAKSLMDLGHSNLYDLAGALANASQAAAGDGGAVEHWAETLSPGMKQYALELSVGYCMKDLHEPPLMDEEFRKARRELLAAIFSDTATTARGLKGKYSPDIPCFASTFRMRPQDGGLFDPSDIIAAIDMIPEKNPNRAEFLLAKAELMNSQGATPEEVVKIHELAQSVAGNDAKVADVVRVYRAHYLDGKKGRMMEAVELAKQVNPDHLTTDQKRRLQWVLDHAAKMKTPEAPK